MEQLDKIFIWGLGAILLSALAGWSYSQLDNADNFSEKLGIYVIVFFGFFLIMILQVFLFNLIGVE